MEEENFLAIRNELVANASNITEGKMMSSPAITIEGKVFAFFSRKGKMVFKLGDNYEPENTDERPFNPFKNKGPLRGWYKVDFDNADRWRELAIQAKKVVSDEV